MAFQLQQRQLYHNALLLMFCAVHVNSLSWWLLGASPPSGGELQCEVDYLTPAQRVICNNKNSVLASASRGANRGIAECQSKFNDTLWNCTTYQGSNLFGSFIAQRTRETAMINYLLAAGAAQHIAEQCREQLLGEFCTCSFKTESPIPNVTTTFGCSDPVIYATNFIRNDFLQLSSSATSQELVDRHNIEAGLSFVADTKIHCRCHGFSGSCSVRTCRFLTPNMDEIGAHARREYTFSVQVTTNITTKEITPVNSIAVTNLANSPVHLNSSPNFCNADIPNGIPGTKGRKCSRVTGAIDSCDVVCCQRGAEARIIERPKECCDFVWCCRVECKPCGVETFTEYVCK